MIMTLDVATTFWSFEFDYSRTLVEWQRAHVPSYFKRWDPVRKMWTMSFHYGLKFLHETMQLSPHRWHGLVAIDVIGQRGQPPMQLDTIGFADLLMYYGSSLKGFEDEFISESPMVLAQSFRDGFLRYIKLPEVWGAMASAGGVFVTMKDYITIGNSKIYSQGGGLDMKGAFGSRQYKPNSLFFTQRALWEWFEGGLQTQTQKLKLDFDAPNAFKFFGLAPNATDTEINSAYKAAVFQTHPDHGGKADEFITVREMHDKLKDPRYKKRVALAEKYAPALKAADTLSRPVIPKTIYHPPVSQGEITVHGVQAPGGLFVLQIEDWTF